MAEWYAEGLRFECTQCGACCTGPPGYVTVTPEDVTAIASLLGMDREAFIAEHANVTSMGRSLNEVETAAGHDCVFLDREIVPGKAVCTIYGARPLQCRTFPWWPENLRSPGAWRRLGKDCEGVGRGDFVPVDRIRIDRDRQARGDGTVSR